MSIEAPSDRTTKAPTCIHQQNNTLNQNLAWNPKQPVLKMDGNVDFHPIFHAKVWFIIQFQFKQPLKNACSGCQVVVNQALGS